MLDLNKNEEQILQYWADHKILEKTRQKNRGRKPFYFLDGPPFVSGDLHPGQMWVKTMKDVLLRYKRFRGFDVYDRAGYDVHGLPIEKRAEAQLGITSKKEIESRIGVENFIKACNDYVESYIGRMDKDFNRFGISLDFSNPYIPSKKPYMEIAWGYVKQYYAKGLLYKDRRATTFCTSCGTSVSQGSMEVEYRIDTDPSIFVAFKVVGKSSSPKVKFGDELYLLVWTTTPWTLPANIATAVNPEEQYVIARIGGRRYALIKSRLDAISEMLKESAVIEGEFLGSDMEGMHYVNPLEELVPMQKEFRKYHKVIMAKELVSSAEGSGIVHIAPGHGLEDYLIGKKHKLPIFSPVDKEGKYTQEAGQYAGLKVPEDANKKVLTDLRTMGALVYNSTITHSYPHCWRCDTKLIFIATEQWFINIQKVKKKLLSENRKVMWHPSAATEWQENVLQSSPDWAISRQRYWGIPLPIWECRCGERLVIGSMSELAGLAVNKDYVNSMQDIHRPYIDNVVVKCPKCGSEMSRISDVLDVWFDSSIAYRASLTKEQFDNLFPVDFVLEGMDQLRGWFSYQLKMGTMIEGRRPFNNVVIDGMMLGEDGREMHKRLGNYISLADMLKITTADAFRIWCTSHTPELDLIFSKDKVGEANKVVIMLYNISNLIKEYSEAMSYKSKKIKKPSSLERLSLEDAWIVSRLNSTIKASTESLDNYEIYKAVNAIRSFIVTDLSRFYLKIAKKKILYSGKKESKATLSILNYVFYNTIMLIAPIAPFAAESIYTERYPYSESVFLADWPKSGKKLLNAQAEENFNIALDAVTAILNSREKSNLKLRQPLSRAIVETDNAQAFETLQKLSYIIEDYTNIKKLEVNKVERGNAEIRPNFAKIGPDFKQNGNAVANAIKSADSKELLNSIARNGEYKLRTASGEFTINQGHFTAVEKLDRPDSVPFRYGVTYVDKEISKELQDEALLREFERRVQLARKEMGLKKGDRVKIYYKVPQELHEVVYANIKQVKSDLNATGIFKSNEIKTEFSKQYDLEGQMIEIGIDRV